MSFSESDVEVYVDNFSEKDVKPLGMRSRFFFRKRYQVMQLESVLLPGIWHTVSMLHSFSAMFGLDNTSSIFVPYNYLTLFAFALVGTWKQARLLTPYTLGVQPYSMCPFSNCVYT